MLAGTTTLAWSGNAAIRLAVPKPATYKDSDVDLTVKGATYAFVRLMNPYRPGCPDIMGPRCDTSRVTWLHGLHDRSDYNNTIPVSRRHDAAFSVPAGIPGPFVDVLLFTDGQASVTIRAVGLRGTSAYRPARPFHGRASLLRPTCVPLGCQDATGRSNGLTYGGETFDLKGAGWVEYYAIGRDDNEPGSVNQVHTIAGCMYPNPADRDAPADPASHRYGCDDTHDTTAAATSATRLAAAHAGTANPGVLKGYNSIWSGARDKQYVGYQGIGAGPSPSRAIAYGIWFRFLE